MSHEPCKQWTVKVEHEEMVFFLTNIPFRDIAEAAANGISQQTGARTKVYYTKLIDITFEE